VVKTVAMETITIHGEKPEEVENPSKCVKFKRAYPKFFAPLQSDTYDAIKNGNTNLALIAPTSSGKTLAIAAPIFEFKKPTIFVYPFRALVLDQTNQLINIAKYFGIQRERFESIVGGIKDRTISEAIEKNKFILATPDKLISLFNEDRIGKAAVQNILTTYNFVFDEVHVYNSLMRTSLIYFIRSVIDWRESLNLGKTGFYFLSATFPEDLWLELKRELQMSKSDRIEGISYTGTVTLKVKPLKESIFSEDIPIAMDIKELGITNNLVCIFNTALKAWKVTEALFGKEEALKKIFVGQDKMAEADRVRNFESFRENKSEALIGSPAIEAGVDFSAKNLVVEETFTDSFLQRIGRAARKGEDSFVLVYSDLLDEMKKNGDLREEYERREFLGIIQKHFHIKESRKIFEGLAAYAYYKFWKGESDIFKEEHLRICERLENKDVANLVAFRSFTPYMRYETGEAISFKSLFKKNLQIVAGKVKGKPDVRKYFYAKKRAPVQADLLKVALQDKADNSVILLGKIAFHLDSRREYWTVLEIAPKDDPDEDDNICLNVQGKTYGKDITGVKSANVRFFEVDA
jgi:CRISPR/Cas system-associated endonuclease/helicase Cas3